MRVKCKSVYYILVGALLASCFSLHAQVTILNGNMSTFNVTPKSLCEVSIMNSGTAMEVIIKARILNAGNEPMLVVQSNPFLLKKGLNAPNTLNLSLQSVTFSSSQQGQYLRSSHTLSSGRFHYCVSVIPVSASSDTYSDDYCEDIESDLSSFLFLVSPADKEIIETAYPLLVWSHSEPFNMLASGEYYRLVLVELQSGQSAEAGITSNTPVFMKNNLRMHQVQYPFDAHNLKVGQRYGWQLQRVVNGVVTEKSESWEFSLAGKTPWMENKYAELRKVLDGGYYTAENNKVFFKYDESYLSGTISCLIYNATGDNMQANAHNANAIAMNTKQGGYNAFEINLDNADIGQGFYILEVKNDKGEKLFLKFLVP